MKVSEDTIELSPNEIIPWEKVQSMKLLNNKLIIELTHGHNVEVGNLLPSSIDLAFRAYEHYLSQHPEKK